MFFLFALTQCTQGDDDKVADALAEALDAAVLSVDQYTWSVAGDWRRALATNLDAKRRPGKRDPSLGNYFKTHEEVVGVVIADSAADHARVISFADRLIPGTTLGLLRDSLTAKRALLGRMIDWQADGYQRIEILHLPATQKSASHMAFVFIHETDSSSNVISIIIDTEQFIRGLLKPRLQELADDGVLAGDGVLARDGFMLACFRANSTKPVCSTTKLKGEDLRIRRQLLSLPEYELGIAPK